MFSAARLGIVPRDGLILDGRAREELSDDLGDSLPVFGIYHRSHHDNGQRLSSYCHAQALFADTWITRQGILDVPD